MILVLDGHAFLWWASNESTLAPEARAAISDSANEIIVSSATVWELEIKRALGTLIAPSDLMQVIEVEGFSCLPVSCQDGAAAARLPLHHRDPFDRLLIAQARRIGAVLVTRDEMFNSYEVDILAA